MEALIVVAAALIVIVLLESGYQIALCLMRWTPSPLFGLIAAWIAHRQSGKPLEATALFVATALIAQRLPRLFRDRRL